MPSKYGFATEEELNTQAAREERAVQEKIQQEVDRINPLITEILEDFCAASGLQNCKVIRHNEQWTLMQQDAALFTALVASLGAKETPYLNTLETGLSEVSLASRNNLDKLYEVLEREAGLMVRKTTKG